MLDVEVSLVFTKLWPILLTTLPVSWNNGMCVCVCVCVCVRARVCISQNKVYRTICWPSTLTVVGN